MTGETKMNTTTTQLINAKGNPVANHFVIRDGEAEYLQSYKSIVVMQNDDGITFGRDWDYSPTNLRHVKHYLGISDSLKAIKQDIQQGLYNYDATM